MGKTCYYRSDGSRQSYDADKAYFEAGKVKFLTYEDYRELEYLAQKEREAKKKALAENVRNNEFDNSFLKSMMKEKTKKKRKLKVGNYKKFKVNYKNLVS